MFLLLTLARPIMLLSFVVVLLPWLYVVVFSVLF